MTAPENILVPLDFSDVSSRVVRQAASLAGPMKARIILLHVAGATPDSIGYEMGPMYIRDSVAGKLRRQHRELQEYQHALEDEGLAVVAMLVPGRPATKIVKEAERLGSRMIVLGSHGHGALHHLFEESVCRKVLRNAPCPVLVVPSSQVPAEV